MHRLAPALIALSLIAGPAAAFGPTIDMPSLSFPDSSGNVSTQGCVATQPTTNPCE
ncbi:hypothetical protein PGB28_12880 [Primorskyibacter aestuariivivens]|uniref:hypothetical protein n=1 Tax=Primorskyibacter aestuariivivens TaxID=1888912 RepID=UPI002300B222|nr:hypothetical protein [Primorskyibacter aestuariivivens]MDA7429359.1 hypothetical protein [Primorskyibacter aestuariivivens]